MTCLGDYRGLLTTLSASLILLSSSHWPAFASNGCEEAGVGQCLRAHDAVTAAAWTGDGFTAIARGQGGLDVLRITRDGEVAARAGLDLPDWVLRMPDAQPRVDKVVAGRSGSALLVGSVLSGSGDGQRQAGLVGRIDGDGRTEWAGPVRLSADTSVILYSGLHDARAGRFLVVGRHTNGADSGRCAFWSQAYAAAFPDSGPLGDWDFLLHGEPAPGPHNRAAFYDIAAGDEEGTYALVGFATAPAAAGDGCQDDMLVLEATFGAEEGWAAHATYHLGFDDADEVAFAVASLPTGGFVLGGYGVEPGSGARAAVTVSFDFGGGAPVLRHHPYPQDGTDDGGGDRYRAVAAAAGGADILVAGSASESRTARNHGLWRRLTASLDDDGPAAFLTRAIGSDILALAAAPDGRVLAAGTHRDGDGNRGWLGLIQGGAELAGRRPPDSGLARLTAAEAEQGFLEFSEREVRAGTGYFATDIAEGAVFETRLSLSEASELAISALAASGDIDLMLLDEEGRMVAFSGNLGDAGEYLRAPVGPGRYRVGALALSPVDAYELRIGIAAPAEDEVIAGLMALDLDARRALDRLLWSGGYGRTANPEIGFGAGAARSVLALANTVEPGLSADSLAQFLAAASAAAQ